MRSHYNNLLFCFLLINEVRMPAVLVELLGLWITKKKINIVIISFFFSIEQHLLDPVRTRASL